MTDLNVNLDFKLEHHKKGRIFLEETFQILYKVNIPEKWTERWDKLKEQIDILTEFRRDLPIDPWWPSKFKRINLGQLLTESKEKLVA